MQDLPIGIFDSGIGGLTVAKAIHQFLPNESIIYFGDTAHLPYGDKSPELLRRYISDIAKFLVGQPVKALIIACNTASAVAYEMLKNAYPDLPIFEVIDPAVQQAVHATKNQRIGVIGTKTTIYSHIYLKKILDAMPTAFIVEKATPLLVPMIEEGWIHDQLSREIIEAYLSDTGFQHIDTLILGCTHYPLIRSEVEHYFEQNALQKVHVIDSAIAIAQKLFRYFDTNDFHTKSTKANAIFYVSDLTDSFQKTAELFFDENVALQKVELVWNS